MTISIGDPFALGVNYWPRRKAMRWWAEFDAGEVRDEFAMIRDLGLRHVRVFLLWETFQPAVDEINAGALRDLRTVCDIAAEGDLRIQATFFTGHMSGPNWAPEWLLDRGRTLSPGSRQIVGLARPAGDASPIHDLYATALVVAAEDRLLREVVTELRDHPGLWAWSLGNEPDLFCRPADARAGRAWVRDRTATIRSIDPDRPVLIGLHDASLESDPGLRVNDVAAETDLSVMHGYSIYSGLARAPLDPDFVPFAAALAAALAGRPILFEEFGVNTRWPDGPSEWRDLRLWGGRTRRAHFASEEDAAGYYAAVLPRLVRVGSLGAFAWCFSDYDPALWDRPPCDLQVHERFFGLLRPDGSLKPAALAMQDFALSRPVVQAPERTVDLAVTPDEYYRDPERHMAAAYERFGRIESGPVAE